MLSHVWSSAVLGVDALPIEIETHIEPNIPKWTVVGLPDGAVRESRDRVWAALKNSGLPTPRGAVTVNLAPADVRKEGAAFDLPIALGLLAASGGPFDPADLDRLFILGELSLDGSLRPVRGVLPMAIRARREGMRGVIVPHGQRGRSRRRGRTRRVSRWRRSAKPSTSSSSGLGTPYRRDLGRLFDEARQYPVDFSDVRGQEHVKRALEVAAAGGHNALLVGPPGAGKTMLARRLPTILPPLSADEALETTSIHSVGGKLNGAARHGLVATRPFRVAAPHDLRRRALRRRLEPAPRRDLARPQRRALPRRTARVPAAGAGSPPAAAGRREASRSRGLASASSFPPASCSSRR